MTVPESPRRVVSFSPAATETLFELGLGESVAGVSAFCARPYAARAKRRVGSYNTVRMEILDELKPDLILTVTGYQRDLALNLSKKYSVYPLELPVSVSGIVDFVVKIGLVAGAVEEGRTLAGELIRKIGELEPVQKLECYVEIDLGGPVSFGSYSYITDAFGLLGASSLYRSSPSEWLKPDLDWVLTQDPDAVFYEPKMYSKFNVDDIATFFRKRGWDGMRAAELGNVFVTPRPLDFLAHHGPSFITTALPWLEGKLEKAMLSIGP